MRRRHNVRSIAERQSYTCAELVKKLKIHKRTAQEWHREGMQALNPDGKPLLFAGGEVKRFLKARLDSKRCKLQSDEFYCIRCRLPRKSHKKDLRILITSRLLSDNNRQVIVGGICEVCGCQLSILSSEKVLIAQDKFSQVDDENIEYTVRPDDDESLT